MALLKDILESGVRAVSQIYPEGEAREMVFSLLEHILGTKKHTHIIEPAYKVPDLLMSAVSAAIDRLASGEPLQYVIGKANFYGRDFNVNPAVLIPRPETEILCRLAITYGASHVHDGRGLRVLDLCTGSGCIAWTMALECPGSEVTAADISDDALNVASSQDFRDELSGIGGNAPEFIKADILADIPSCLGTYDIVLSNPPYVMDKEKALMRANVLDHEPHLALFVPDHDPLVFYHAVARWSRSLLSADGVGIVEINEALGQETAKVFTDAGFASAKVLQDFSGRDRFVFFSRSSTGLLWNKLSGIL